MFWRGGSNEYPQSMFLSRNKKNKLYPCKPQFYHIKVGFKGVKIIKVCFHDVLKIGSSVLFFQELFLSGLSSKQEFLNDRSISVFVDACTLYSPTTHTYLINKGFSRLSILRSKGEGFDLFKLHRKKKQQKTCVSTVYLGTSLKPANFNPYKPSVP